MEIVYNGRVKICDYLLPIETTFIQHIWTVHLYPDYWEGPRVFRPAKGVSKKVTFSEARMPHSVFICSRQPLFT